MNEQRIREIVKEELEEKLKQMQTAVIIQNHPHFADADGFRDRFQHELRKSHRPTSPWS